MTAEYSIDDRRFTYHRAIAPMMWVLVGLSLVELLVVHLFLAHWFPRAAMLLSVVTASGVIWLVVAIAGFARRPIEIDERGVLMRVGIIRQIYLPRSAIAGVRRAIAGDEHRSQTVLNLALIAYPNVIVDLTAPVEMRRRSIRAVAHRLDDPAAFANAIDALGAGA
ncbi:hypothetical protein [Sphingomonas sp. RS2018]